jgi:hypothetical protein
MSVVRGVLTAYAFYETDMRGEARTRKWLAASVAGSPKFANEPVVVVVTDESGVEIARTAFGEISDEFKDYVEDQLLQNRKTI